MFIFIMKSGWKSQKNLIMMAIWSFKDYGNLWWSDLTQKLWQEQISNPRKFQQWNSITIQFRTNAFVRRTYWWSFSPWKYQMLSEKTGNSCYRWYKQECSSWHISEKKKPEIAFLSLFLDFQHQIGIKLYVMMKVTLSNNKSRK